MDLDGHDDHCMIAEITFVVSFFIFLLVERFLNATSILVLRLIFGKSEDVSDVRGYASVQLLGAGFTYVATLCTCLANLLAVLISSIASYLIWACIVTFLFAIVYILQEFYPEILLEIITIWNENIGPVLQQLLVTPLQIADIAFSAVVPVYDAAVWLFSKLFYNVFVLTAIRDLSPYMDFAVALSHFFKTMTFSLVAFVNTVAYPCQTGAPALSPTAVSDACYDASLRSFDFITPMASVRGMAVANSKVCSTNWIYER